MLSKVNRQSSVISTESLVIFPWYSLQNEVKVMRKYYIGIQRNDEVIYVRDSVLLKSGPRRKDLPFVARVSGFWEEAEGKHDVDTRTEKNDFLRRQQTVHSPKCSALMKTALNNVLLPTLFNVVNNTEQVVEPELACSQV